jgi:hypothetical protein
MRVYVKHVLGRMREGVNSSEGRGSGIDMMVYSKIFQDQGAGEELEHMLGQGGKSDGCRLSDGKRPAEDAEGGKPGAGERVREEAAGRGEREDIIRSRIGRRSYTLRDRTQNDVGVLSETGTRHRRQSRCAYGRARTAAVALVVEERAATTMRRRRKMNEFAIVLNSTILAKLGPV